MVNNARLDILIEAKNKASPELRKLQGDLRGLDGSAQVLSGLAKGFAAVGGAVAAINTARAVYDLARLGAQSQATASSFETLTNRIGVSSADMLAALREASGGTISNSELMLAANRAMVAGVANSTEEITQLLEIARNQAKFFGLTTQQAFSDLVLGLARGEAEIIDNLGIVVKAGEEYEAYGRSIGKAANELTAAERTAALTNAVLREGGKLLGENAGQGDELANSFARMDTAIQNAKEALGLLFTPAAAAIANNLAEATERMLKAMEDTARQGAQSSLFGMGDSITRMAAELNAQASALTDAALGGDNAGVAAAGQRIQELTIAIRALGAEYNATAAQTGADLLDLDQLANGVVAFQDNASAAREAAAAELEMAQASAELSAQQSALQAQILGTVDRLREIQGVAAGAASALRSSFLGVADTIGGAAALGGYRKAKQELDAQIAIYEQLGFSAEEIEFATAGFVAGIRDANSELEKTVTGTTRIASGVNTAQQAFDNLKSRISGLLSGALQSGIDLDGILGRQDAIEEPARRLADIAVNGFNSPWTKYFQEQFPQLYEQLATSGNPRQAAAGILREFEAGLRPELLDRETAKERVRQLLLGESNIEGLAQSIAQELSGEFSNQFSQAQILQTAQQALGQGAAGALDVTAGLNAAPGAASKVLGQVEAQFATDGAVNKAKAIGAALAGNLFNGYDEAAGGFPWWDRLLAIILRQQIEAGA